MAIKLDEESVAAIAPPERGTITVWDTELPGFGVRVFPAASGASAATRSFFLNYRVDGRERRLTLGKLGDIGAREARRRASAHRKLIGKGADPARERQERREAPTVRDLAERYKTEHLPSKAPKSQGEDSRIIEKKILPWRPDKASPPLGERRVADIHAGDMKALHRSLTEAGTPVRANRVLAVASKMFSLALEPKAGESTPWRRPDLGNPCSSVKRNREEGRERFFSIAEQAAIADALETQGRSPAADCLRFLMLTGCRPNEAMQATWEQFDAEPGFWVKPSAHTKDRRRHKVPLAPAALEMIERRRVERVKAEQAARARGKGSRFVFPGQRLDAPLKQLRSTWASVVDRATVILWSADADDKVRRLIADLERSLERAPSAAEARGAARRVGVNLSEPMREARPYDLRHTFAATGASGGVGLQIIGRLMGHTVARTTERYAHLQNSALAEAAAKISGEIAAAGQPGAKVHAFPPGPRG